jgi:DNA-binding HxlR family transcriptional regulator
LTERLDEWVEKWYIIRGVTTTKPLKIRYSLTEKWRKLSAKICDLASFAQENL